MWQTQAFIESGSGSRPGIFIFGFLVICIWIQTHDLYHRKLKTLIVDKHLNDLLKKWHNFLFTVNLQKGFLSYRKTYRRENTNLYELYH